MEDSVAEDLADFVYYLTNFAYIQLSEIEEF